MKAIIFDPSSGSPRLSEWPCPQIGPWDVIIKLEAAALNHRDIHISRPGYADKFVYGSDGAGVIIEVGENVEGWEIGDEVIINTFITCMECEDCLSGNHTLCSDGEVLGGPAFAGTFAEYVKVPAKNLARKPDHLSFMESAALPLSLGTAWRAMTYQAGLKPGDTIFIQGIGGGVSLYCMQIAVALGCKVVVTSSSDRKIERAIKMGAIAGINYKREDVIERAKELSKNPGFDVVISSHGGSVPMSMDIVKVGGKIVQFAFLGNHLQSFDIDKVMGKQITLIGTSDQTYPEFNRAIEFVNNIKMKPVISNIFSLQEYEEAFQLMRDGRQFGKIVFSFNEN